jgi:hypothetical protein
VVDAAQVDQIQQAGAVFGEDIADGRLLVIGVDFLGAQPRREGERRVLLEEELLLDAVGIALQRERPVLEVRQDEGRDGVVVVQQVAFDDAFGGVEDFVEIREFEGMAIDGEGDFVGGVG